MYIVTSSLISLSLSLNLFFSLTLFLSLSFSLSVFLALYPSLSFFFFIHLYLSLYLFLPIGHVVFCQTRVHIALLLTWSNYLRAKYPGAMWQERNIREGKEVQIRVWVWAGAASLTAHYRNIQVSMFFSISLFFSLTFSLPFLSRFLSLYLHLTLPFSLFFYLFTSLPLSSSLCLYLSLEQDQLVSALFNYIHTYVSLNHPAEEFLVSGNIFQIKI